MPSYDPQNEPGYANQGGYGAPARPVRNGVGIAALIFGILAILTSITVVGGVLLGIVAIVLGFIGRSRFKKREATNGGVALAGIITGALGLVLSIVLVVAGAALFFGSGGSDLVNCVNSAKGDQARIQQCNNQFQQGVTGY